MKPIKSLSFFLGFLYLFDFDLIIWFNFTKLE